jgi:hypothetical protein
MTNYPLLIAAGATLSINTQSSFVYYESASAGGADTSIKLVTENGDEFILKVGQGARLKKDFKSLYVSNVKGQGTIIGNLVLSDGDFVDHRVVGTVEVIDGGKNRTMAGIAFMVGGGSGAVAAQMSQSQLWNPVGSNVNIVLSTISLSASSATSYTIGPTAQAPMTGLNRTGISKKVGAGAAKGEARGQASAVNLVTGAMQYGYLQANVVYPYKFSEPIVLMPGFGLGVALDQPNVGLLTTFEWYEEAL